MSDEGFVQQTGVVTSIKSKTTEPNDFVGVVGFALFEPQTFSLGTALKGQAFLDTDIFLRDRDVSQEFEWQSPSGSNTEAIRVKAVTVINNESRFILVKMTQGKGS